MLSIIDLTSMLKAAFPDIQVFPLEFPINSPSNSMNVDITSSSRIQSGTFTLEVQIKVRDIHPGKAEAASLRVVSFLEKKTNYMLGDLQVIMSEASNPYPLFMGRDGNDNYLYSNNFRLLVNKGDNA